MAELVPSSLLHSQAIKLLDVLLSDESNGTQLPEEYIADLSEIVSSFTQNAGQPLFSYFTFDDTEPPSSEKMNKLWKAIAADVDVIQQQVDVNRAAVISTFNYATAEMEKLRLDNARMKNKVKTLQLYSSGSDSKTVFFGDSFESLGFLDASQIDASEVPYLAGPGVVTLPQVGASINVSKEGEISILESSNGFIGRNQEALETDDGIIFTGDELETSFLDSVLDARPDTWFEYEKVLVEESDRIPALGLNIEYQDEEGNRLSWVDGPSDGVLRLGLEIDLGQVENINTISILPFGLEGEKNHPITIKKIQTSNNKTDWSRIPPSDIVIGNTLNLATARTADESIVRKAFWQFDSRTARYVRVYIEQVAGIQSTVGHPYWVNRDTDQREEGPIPQLGRVLTSRNSKNSGDLEQNFETFSGKRWAIGLRDIEVTQTEYGETGTFVTRPLRAGGVVDRVVLEDAEVEIPDSFGSSEDWVSFYISPDNGENWYQISEIEDSLQGVPEQISFNDPIPPELRESKVQNYNTNDPVTEIRFKAILRRPPGVQFASPVLKSYRLKVRRR